MAYFHCLIGGGSSGGGYELTVTCDADFAGTTITATDGVTTLTQTCPSASPYTVEFEIPNGGTWTVSGIVSGSTFTASIDIPDELELIAIPEGSTVTPTDVIQTWLRCGGIFDKSYTTLNEVLADSTTLLALMSNNNAVDYLVRSTTWASGITANSTAMTDIGANNYCADTLLSNSTWLNAICNSIYFESVLNVKVPTMTSDTTPSGDTFCTNHSGSTAQHNAYMAFDGVVNSTNTTAWASSTTNSRVGYHFTQNVKISKVRIQCPSGVNNNELMYFKVQYSDDGTNFTDATEQLTFVTAQPSSAQDKSYAISLSDEHPYWAILAISSYGNQNVIRVCELQFYGRHAST